MALISVQEAASRIGVSVEAIEQWGERGLLAIRHGVRSSNLPADTVGWVHTERCVDEDELLEVAESLGWLRLSTDSWHSAEEQ